jgi:hypothetical protein
MAGSAICSVICSEALHQESIDISMNKCSNCTKVNFQLDNALGELRSANLIIELLQKELNCINTDKSLVSTSDISNLPQQ